MKLWHELRLSAAQSDKPGGDDRRRIARQLLLFSAQLGETLHYLADFIAKRPRPNEVPDISFFAELLALIVCPFGLLMFAISLVFFIRSGRPTTPRE